LNAFQLTPSEPSPSSPLHVPGGDDSRRAEMIEIVKQLDELGLSQFVPDPRAAIPPSLVGARRRSTKRKRRIGAGFPLCYAGRRTCAV
jgi:hypothetical protein